MKVNVILVCIAILLISLSMPEALLISPSVPKAMAQFQPGMGFYGHVYVGGQPAQDGLEVKAVIAGTTLNWTTATSKGKYAITVDPNEPETPGKNGGVPGDTIQFYVHGINTNQFATFINTVLMNLTLSIPAISNGSGPTPNPTSLSLSLSPQTSLLSLSSQTQTSLLGSKVNLNGILKSNGSGVGRAAILLSYSVTWGQTWNNITSINTSPDGSLSAVWMPSATATYLIKAKWAGNNTFQSSEILSALFVTSLNDQYVFSVTSNSTVSALAYNSTSRVLSFTVAGPPGTRGFTDVAVSNSLMADTTAIKVYLDGSAMSYTATSTSGSWLLHLTYTHSTHSVIIDLGPQTSNTTTPMYLQPILRIAILICVSVVGIIVFRKIKKSNVRK